MATLVTCRELSKSYHARPLFHDLSLAIDDADRAGLIGPNGAGKSTLLRILAGSVTPDHGNVTQRRGLRIAYVAQEDSFAPGASVTQTLEDAASTLPRPHEHTDASMTLSRIGLTDPDQSVDALRRLAKTSPSRDRTGARLLLLDGRPTTSISTASSGSKPHWATLVSIVVVTIFTCSTTSRRCQLNQPTAAATASTERNTFLADVRSPLASEQRAY